MARPTATQITGQALNHLWFGVGAASTLAALCWAIDLHPTWAAWGYAVAVR